LLAATVIYLIGVFGVTVFGNVPLNNTLERFNLDSASEKEKSLFISKKEIRRYAFAQKCAF
jgi:uncharacterized membrane protein